MRITATLLIAALSFNAIIAQDGYEAILKDYFNDNGTGVAAIVTKGDEVLYRGAIGKASLELDVDMQPEYVFRLGSITKQFTAVAIMMLQEDGKLNISDPITKYLPDYPMGEKTITVEHLLTHTSGIQSYTDVPGFFVENARTDMPLDELIDFFKDRPMNFDPGTEWRYNNSGYILLGAIIERVSGETYEEFIESEIFKPLGMKSSYYDVQGDIIDGRVPGYMPDGAGGVRNADYLSMTLPYAAGSLLSTVDDMVKWNKAVMHGEVISDKSMSQALSPYVLENGDETNYGYGWSLATLARKKVYEHGGGIHGFLTDAMYIPEEDVYVAVLSNCNCQPPDPAAWRLAALAIGEPMEYEPIQVDPKTLEDYIGVYAIEGSDEIRVITVENGILTSQRNDGGLFTVQPYDVDKFFYESLTTLEFVRDDNGEVIGQIVTPMSGEGGYAALTDAPIPGSEEIEVGADLLNSYTGVYNLLEGMDVTITVQNGELIGTATGQGPITLSARADDTFVFRPAGIKITFDEPENGKSPAFTFEQGGQTMRAERK